MTTKKSGEPLTREEREALGQKRIGIWLDPDAAAALAYAAKRLATERKLPASRSRTYAISEALKKLAESMGWRVPKKSP